MYNCCKEHSTDIVFNVLYIYIYFILFYIMYNIHVVKRFRAHCGFYAIENKLLLLIIILLNQAPPCMTQFNSRDCLYSHISTTHFYHFEYDSR